MRKLHTLVVALLSALALTQAAAAQTLYDPVLGTLPAAQGWTTLGSGSMAGSQAVDAGVLTLDTRASGVGAYGNGRISPQPLDTDAGFRLLFELRIAAETHDSDNRAGFSLLLQGADQTRALELGFWEDRIWVLDYVAGGDDSGFVRGAGVAFDTTAAQHSFVLQVQQHQFELHAGGNLLLSGALRDYPTLGLSTLVYGQSNYLFFGDNSSRGTVLAELGAITLAPIPEPATALLLAAGIAALAFQRR